MRYYLYTLGVCIAFAGCNSKPTTQQKEEATIDSLKTLIMASHDTTMAEMNRMAQLRNDLKKLKGDTMEIASDTIMYQKAYIDLMSASNAMMDWMAQFENPDEMLISNQEKVNYLKEQHERMQAIEKETFEVIAKAESLTEKER